MCNNRHYTDSQKKALDKMGLYAKMILEGISIEDIALDDDTTVEVVEALIEDIKNVNPYLYNQVKEKLAS